MKKILGRIISKLSYKTQSVTNLTLGFVDGELDMTNIILQQPYYITSTWQGIIKQEMFLYHVCHHSAIQSTFSQCNGRTKGSFNTEWTISLYL